MIADEIVGNVVKANAQSFVVALPLNGLYPNSLGERLCQHPFYENRIVGAQTSGLLSRGFLWLEGGIKPSLLVVAGERASDPIVKQTWLDNIESGIREMPEGITCIAIPAVLKQGITAGDYYARLDTLPQDIILCRARPWWEEDV